MAFCGGLAYVAGSIRDLFSAALLGSNGELKVRALSAGLA